MCTVSLSGAEHAALDALARCVEDRCTMHSDTFPKLRPPIPPISYYVVCDCADVLQALLVSYGTDAGYLFSPTPSRRQRFRN